MEAMRHEHVMEAMRQGHLVKAMGHEHALDMSTACSGGHET